MIDLIFYYGTDIILVRVDGKNIIFNSSGQLDKGGATIDGIKLNKAGAIKEFPDLDGRDDWKEEAIKRFKNKIMSMRNEDEIAEYIIEDLKLYGYVPKFKQKVGFRKEKL